VTFVERRTNVSRFITITGTRNVNQSSEQLDHLFGAYLGPFAQPDAHFFVGGAVGIDTMSLDWLADHSSSLLTVVVPCTVADQPTTAAAAIRRWRDLGRLADVVELGADRLGTDAYHARNRWMVDRSAMVAGFPQADVRSGGTWFTIDYAADQGKSRLIVPV
jgi:predicted Rossmann fold nucleotide-binding protein DprA/Smf involved in DNA uptake